MIRLFFRLPWFVYLILSVIAAGTGFSSYGSAKKYNEDRRVALAGSMPALIDSGDITEESFTDVGEAYVGAQISDKIFTVSVSGRRTLDKEKTAVFAFSENASSASDEVSVVFMLEPRDSVEEFINLFSTGEPGSLSPKLHVNGLSYHAGSKLGNVVKDAATQASINLSSSVQFVEPLMMGREQGIEPRSPMENLTIFAVISALLALFGLVKFLRSPGKKVAPRAISSS